MASVIISEFMQALDEEILALKKGKGGSATKVFNGRFLREASGQFIYLFSLENFLAVLDEAPAEIDIKGQHFSAQVLANQGLSVEIGIEQYLGNFVAEAKLKTNLWYLLELLKKKFAEQANSQDFALSEVAFGMRKASKPDANPSIEYTTSSQVNKAQRKAIEASFASQLSIIWGPPGTGKTSTIAKAVEAHLNAGRRVLLVSHANNAVDEALEDIAEHLKPTPFYCDGSLVRLGKPQEEHLRKLEQDYEMVLVDKIAESHGKSLLIEKEKLEREYQEVEKNLGACADVELVQEDIAKLTALKSASDELRRAQTNAKNDLRALEIRRNENEQRLHDAEKASALKRIFTGLNPEKIRKEIVNLDRTIESKKRLEQEIVDRLSKAQTVLDQKIEQAKESSAKATAILGKLNISLQELSPKKKALGTSKDQILTRQAEISHQLNELEKRIISEARLVATTLTKTFTAKNFPNTPFDVLILDEASMAPLPHLYWAAGRCGGFVTIVGDFLQLPPICISEQAMAQKWLGRSIFSVLGIDGVDKADSDERVTLLDTQYRMPPEISEIPNRFFYLNRLKDDSSTSDRRLDDGISESPLVLIETAGMNPWCSRLSTGGRFNLYNALVAMTIAKRIIDNDGERRIGIMTPYSAQARLINKIAKDWSLSANLRISTVHRFQGGQEEIIIFDTVESPGAKIAPMLDDTRDISARLLLNVALTRSQNRLYFIGHTQYLVSSLSPSSSLARITQHFLAAAEISTSERFVDNYFASDFDAWAEKLIEAETPRTKPVSGGLFTEKNFWPQFLDDLKTVDQKLIILSPFLSLNRAGPFMDYFRSLKNRGVEVCIYSKPRNEQIGQMADQAEAVIDQLRAIGVKVIERQKMHQKIAVLDDEIAWEGSLNILSHRDTGEQMRRFEGQSTIEEIIRNLELDQEMPVGFQTSETCPNCGAPLVVRAKYGRKFLACSNWPKVDKKGFIKPLGDNRGPLSANTGKARSKASRR